MNLIKAHHLVAAAFFDYDRKQYVRKSSDSLVVDHLNGNKQDNRIENLEVVTQRENIKRFWDRIKEKTGNGKKG